jgi:hypothetical protein
VYGVNEEFGLIIIDVKGIDWADKGSRFLLKSGTHAPIEFKINQIDASGLAVAYAQGSWSKPMPVKNGDTVSISPAGGS